MIKKIYAFNERGEALLKRQYGPTLDDACIRGEIASSPDCNFVKASDTIVYRRADTFYVAFVVENENEMYILSLISHLMSMIEQKLGAATESAIVYNFRDCHALLDTVILNGKIILLDPAEALRSVRASSQQ